MVCTDSLDITVCQDFRSRLIGLRHSQPIGPRKAVWLTKCRYVHTFGIREPLSLIFLDSRLTTKAVVPATARGRIYGHSTAASVIELAHRPLDELVTICKEILLLANVIDATEYFLVGRIKARVKNAANEYI